jgi:sugar lactone lactonase YvrE
VAGKDQYGNQSVPTSLAVGRDGTIYVGELNGENPGTARVLKLSASGALLGYVGGFTTVSGVAVGQDGTFYVSELFGGDGESGPPGQVTTVRPNGSRSSQPVPFPAGLAVDSGRHLYVSAWSVADADGTDLGEPEEPTDAAAAAVSPPGQVWRLS